jgi:hypothetical protein
MKQLKYIIFFVASLVFSAAFYSCEDESCCNGNATEPVIHRVFLEDANSNVPDREVDFARLEQTIRLEGENFLGLTKVYINGYSCYFNPVFVADNSMLVRINENVPITDAAENVRNKIRLEKGDKYTIFDFEIRAAAPSITNVSHTLPLADEWVTITGNGLVEIKKVIFPGNIEVTEIEQGKDGKFFNVKVPAGIPEAGGSIYVEGSNGGAYSPAYFGCKNNVILDFDGRGVHAFWGTAINDTELLSAVIGEGNKSQGLYCPMLPRDRVPIASGAPRATEVWTDGNENWRDQFVTSGIIEANAPLEEVAIQFDLYVPEDWNNTGFLSLNLANNFSAGNQWTGEFYNIIPWLDGSTMVAYKTAGWVTVTVPLNKFYAYSKGSFTFNDVLVFRETASNKNFGMFFNNNDFTLKDITGLEADESKVFPSMPTSVEIYVDNFRIVSLKAPKYSDFPDEEAE